MKAIETNETGELVHDLYLVSYVCVMMQISVKQLCVLAYMFRNKTAEYQDLLSGTGISRSHLYRQLDYLVDHGELERRERKDADRAKVYVWSITEQGKRTILDYERLYRKHTQRVVRACGIACGERGL